MEHSPRILIIACGALAKEILALRTLNRWSHMAVQCIPANLHNRPEKISEAVREKIHINRGKFASMFVAYGDCGTGGMLDVVLAEEGVERIPGAHCYEFFAGPSEFARLSEQEIGTFYLTDFLLRHFDRLIIAGLGIDKHPALLPIYFGNYTKLVYLGQLHSQENLELGRRAAERLGLEFDYHFAGYGDLADSLAKFDTTHSTSIISWQN